MDTDPIALVSTLIEAGSVDTVYRDLYLGRAQTLLSPLISLEDFHRLEQQQAALAELPLAVARALEKGDWPLVKELSQRADAVKQVVTSEAKRLATARGVYAVTDVQLDPFCHSLQKFTRVSARDLPALRSRIAEELTALEQSDVPWRDFYAGRRAAFQTRAPIDWEAAPTGGVASTSPDSVREAAAQALKAGDMKRLAQLADLMPTGTPGASESRHGAPTATIQTPQQASQDLVASWSSDTLTHARQLGLGARHLETRGDLASLRQYAWSPFSDESRLTNIKQVTLPSGSRWPSGPGRSAHDPPARELWRRATPADVRRRGRARRRLPGSQGRRTATVVAIAGDPRAFPSPRADARGDRAGIAHARHARAGEGARPRPAGVPSRLHPVGCPSSTPRGRGLRTTALLDSFRWIPHQDRRGPATATGARRWRCEVRRSVRPARGQP